MKRKLLREQRQLSYQLFVASTDQEMLLACLVKGGIDLREQYQGYELIASRLITDLAAGKKPSVDLIDASLVAHKELRHLYDQFGRSDRGSFDVVYRPLGGWKAYFERCSNELHCIEEMQSIRRETNAIG
ncbi:MAG: hypothetical protein ACT6Q5_12040 [Sphingopyxis solisilvae]|uniref:hypothetical protein n=1 Tax=Sphingopyxis solisilvae TaxID=1886788 RepID=UPI004034FC23